MPRGPLWQTRMEQRQALSGHYEWQCKGVEIRRNSIAAVLSWLSFANLSQVHRWDPERSRAQIMPITSSVQQRQHILLLIGNSTDEEKRERQKTRLSNMWLMSCRSFPACSSSLQCERQSIKIWPGSIMKPEGGFHASPPHSVTASVKTLDLNNIRSRSANQNVWPPEPELGHCRASACCWVWLWFPSLSTVPHLAHHQIMTVIFPLWRRERDKKNW